MLPAKVGIHPIEVERVISGTPNGKGVPAEHAAARFPALRDRRLPYRRSEHRSDARVGSLPGQRGPGAGCAQAHLVSMPGPCGAFAPATGRQADHGRRAAVSSRSRRS
jgi:hypothetical protein